MSSAKKALRATEQELGRVRGIALEQFARLREKELKLREGAELCQANLNVLERALNDLDATDILLRYVLARLTACERVTDYRELQKELAPVWEARKNSDYLVQHDLENQIEYTMYINGEFEKIFELDKQRKPIEEV